MKKLLLMFLAITLLFCGCDFEQKDTLKNFTKPYTGVYICKSLKVAGIESIKNFKEIRAELNGDGDLTITAIDKTGAKKSAKLEYEYNDGEIIIKSHGGGITSAYEKGKLILSYNLSGVSIIAIFEKN